MNMTLFHRIQFSVGDSAFFAELPGGETVLLVRDIEMDRAKRLAQADRIGCAADYMPAAGLDGDREAGGDRGNSQYSETNSAAHSAALAPRL